MTDNTSCIVVFAKAPIKGIVKTRLAKDIDHSVVVDLYKRFVEDTVEKATQTSQSVKIFYDPPESRPHMINWLGSHLDYYSQTGSNLGDRMYNAFLEMFRSGMDGALLIGTDVPDLPVEYISEALSSILSHDAVIGPSEDGGYYLIGFRSDSFLPEIFNNITWSSNSVFKETMKIFSHSGKSVHILKQWRDVDKYSDLLFLARHLYGQPGAAPKTSAYLKSVGLLKED